MKARRDRISLWLFATACTLLLWALSAFQVQNALPILLAGASLVVFGAYVYASKGNAREENIVLLILFAGFLLKLCYCLYTGVGTRQHDVHSFATSTNGHAGYIKYLIENGHLPDFDPREKFQFYHPPLYHTIAALFVSFNRLIGFPERSIWECLQVLSFFWAAAGTLLVYELLREFDLKGGALYLPLGVFSLHPYFIFLSGSVNNDTLSILFLLLLLVYTLKWAKDPGWKNTMVLALGFGLGMMVKLSVVYMAPVTGLVFLWKLIREKELRKTLVPRFAAFAAVALPLGLWWYIRCYVRFQVPLGYVPSLGLDSHQYLGEYSVWSRFFDFSPESFRYLYLSYGEHGAEYLEHNILLAFLKSAVFEEQTLTKYQANIKPVSAVLFTAQLPLVGYSLYGLAKGFRKTDLPQKITLYGTYALVLASGFMFCFQYPHVCTQSFRYIIPTLFVGTVGLGWAYGSLKRKWPLVFTAVLFCTASVFQFILLGV